MKKTKYMGAFRNTYIAHAVDKETRMKGSSGGVATALCSYLLENKIVEGVVCVGYDEQKPWRYAVSIVYAVDELKKCIGSKYVNISAGEMLKALNHFDGKLAFVGLPCHIEVVERLRKSGKFKNIVLTIGLFCGWPMEYSATEYLIRKMRVRKKDIAKIDYRGGPYPGGFTVHLKNGGKRCLRKYHYDFVNLMFIPKPCLKCSFYMSENADISVGDAWIKGVKNCSSVLVRSDIGKEVFKKAVDAGHIGSEPIKASVIFHTHKHNIKHKKIGDSLLFRIVIRMMNNDVAKKLVPFTIFGWLAKMRRAMK